MLDKPITQRMNEPAFDDYMQGYGQAIKDLAALQNKELSQKAKDEIAHRQVTYYAWLEHQ